MHTPATYFYLDEGPERDGLATFYLVDRRWDKTSSWWKRYNTYRHTSTFFHMTPLLWITGILSAGSLIAMAATTTTAGLALLAVPALVFTVALFYFIYTVRYERVVAGFTTKVDAPTEFKNNINNLFSQPDTAPEAYQLVLELQEKDETNAAAARNI